MCYDPWDHGIYGFANLYAEAVWQSTRSEKSEQYRHVWVGKAEAFASAYPDKLRELDREELADWIENIDDWSGENKERLLIPAKKEQKRRAEESAMVD